MGEAIGLSVGATRFAGVRLGHSAVTRPSAPGLVERVGDPVGMLAADGSMHRGEVLVADGLRELLHTMTGRRSLPTTVTYPAHWRKTQVDALRTVLRLPMISDASASISALQSERGVPARGVIALCDFGGTGTSVTLLDASRGYAPVGPTLRHPDFCGDLIDQALLSHVVADVPPAPADTSGTSALGPLHRLRAQCRAAKERLSGATVTSLTAELPGFRGDIRVTRAELDELIRAPLAYFVQVLQETLDRSRVRPGDLAAVVSVGGSARIPLVTTMLSEQFRVPVITAACPELAAAAGAALRASRGPADDRSTAVAAAVVAPAFADADAHSTTFRALAWSEAHDVPPVAKPEPATGVSRARPQLEFAAADEATAPRELPWYRRASTLAGIGGTVILLLATSAVVAFGTDNNTVSSTPRPVPSSSARPGSAAVEPAPEQPQPRTVYVSPAPAAQSQAPVTRYQAPAPPPPAREPAPSSEPPPPPPSETTTVTTTTQAPAVTTTVTQPAPPPVTVTFPSLPPIPVLNPPHNR